MTKHLRLIMLSLLAMICMGGYSQSEVIIWQEDWTGAKKDNKVNVVSENYSSTGDATKIYEENYAGLKSPELLINGSFTVTINDLKGCQGELKLSFKTNKGKGILSITANGTNIKVPTFDAAKKERITTLNVPQNAESLVIKFNNSGNRRFDDFKLTKVISGKDDSGIKFKEAAKEVELNTVKLSLSDLITNPHNLPITYSTSDKETAAELDGTLLLHKTGKVTITASFAGDDTYAATSTSMELTIVDNRLDAGICFAKDSYTADFAKGTFNEAELVNPNGLEVAYEITPKTEGVNIAEDGTVTYPAVESKYTVTAKFAGNDTYKPATATYTLNVVDNRQDAGIHFAKDSYTADITGGTFKGAELVKPVSIKKVMYTISPESEGVSIAEDGTVTYPAVEATYTVTAKFAGNDTYKPANATYTLNVVDPNVVMFDAAVDKGTREASGKSDKIVNADQFTTTLYGSNAAFNAKGNAYRFYASSHMQISVTKGIITKIKIEGNSQDYPLGNLKLRPEQPGKITSSSDNEVIWEGSANSVRFFNSTSKQFRVSKITVTVKPHYTLDETVDNVIEAAENVNVTLKRTFYKDGGWNTLCLPFAVADAKTAFDGAELREVDTEKSNGNTIVFKEATAIEAGKPYLIKWANTLTEAVDFEKKFEGVTLVAAATPVVVKEGGISFNGFYKMTAASELGGASVAAIGAGNKLFKVTEGSKMKGFRAAFVLSSGAEATKYNVVIDGTATGIEDLVVDGVKANGRVYNLNGQYVGNSLNGLQPGLYIQNGKKIVVK